mmetsp:Transcript_42437/g.81098  ORF Transcript_42437/g.81098 Transcript_42437/m.81098 type:complete len:208 (-) Transcript_42437:486-1109(-)
MAQGNSRAAGGVQNGGERMHHLPRPPSANRHGDGPGAGDEALPAHGSRGVLWGAAEQGGAHRERGVGRPGAGWAVHLQRHRRPRDARAHHPGDVAGQVQPQGRGGVGANSPGVSGPHAAAPLPAHQGSEAQLEEQDGGVAGIPQRARQPGRDATGRQRGQLRVQPGAQHGIHDVGVAPVRLGPGGAGQPGAKAHGQRARHSRMPARV